MNSSFVICKRNFFDWLTGCTSFFFGFDDFNKPLFVYSQRFALVYPTRESALEVISRFSLKGCKVVGFYTDKDLFL